MTEAIDLWNRAWQALMTARILVSTDPDAASSRAYYCAFYAVSALFAIEGRTFTRHSAVLSAVHRELVKTGTWDDTLGRDYAQLIGLRQTGDYGGGAHLSPEDAGDAILAAERIVKAVHESRPEIFTLP